MAQLGNQLAAAQNAGNIAAQTRILNREAAVEQTWLAADRKRLDRVNAQLATGHVSLAKHKQLLQDKLALTQEIGNVIQSIGSAQQTLAGLSSSASSAGGFDLAPGGGGVKAPTIYDVRRRGGVDVHHKSEVRNENHITVIVKNAADVAAVANVIDGAIGGHVHAKLRAAGMRGT